MTRPLLAGLSARLLTASVLTLHAQSAALTIVVIEGEDAVNVIQQKTAVAPVVEVRDRNGQPVPGATVSFAVRAGRASFSGARAMSVTTNAAGRAVAAGFTPTGTGALQITATTAYQGQTAAVAIAQTTVMTATEAAAAGGGAGAVGGSAAGAGGGAGGGVSATTVAVAGGAAAAAGAVAVVKGRDAEVPAATQVTYSGSYSVSYDRNFTRRADGTPTCGYTVLAAGSITANVKNDNGTVSGSFDVRGTDTVTATRCGATGPTVGDRAPSTYQFSVAGSAASFSGTTQNVGNNGTLTVTQSFGFAGALSGSTVTGTVTLNSRIDGSTEFGVGGATTGVTLR
jgi:hypothetical protein